MDDYTLPKGNAVADPDRRLSARHRATLVTTANARGVAHAVKRGNSGKVQVIIRYGVTQREGLAELGSYSERLQTRAWPSGSYSTKITLGLQQTGQSSTYC